METKITLPKFDYMSQGNSYTGNCGSFRYKFYSVEKDEIEKVFVLAHYKNNCFEVEEAAGRTEKKEFEYSAKGIEEAEAWVNSKLGE